MATPRSGMIGQVKRGAEDPVKTLYGDARRAGEPDVAPIKRHALRYEYDDQLEVAAADTPDEVYAARVENVSSTGIALRCRQEFKQHQTIRFRRWNPTTPEAWAEAIVVHCSAGLGTFMIGARFTQPVPELPPPVPTIAVPQMAAADESDDESSRHGQRSGGVLMLVLLVALIAAGVLYMLANGFPGGSL